MLAAGACQRHGVGGLLLSAFIEQLIITPPKTTRPPRHLPKSTRVRLPHGSLRRLCLFQLNLQEIHGRAVRATCGVAYSGHPPPARPEYAPSQCAGGKNARRLPARLVLPRLARRVVVFEAVVEGTELGRVGPVAQRRRGAAAEHRLFVQRDLCFRLVVGFKPRDDAGREGERGGGGCGYLHTASLRLVPFLIMGFWAGRFGVTLTAASITNIEMVYPCYNGTVRTSLMYLGRTGGRAVRTCENASRSETPSSATITSRQEAKREPSAVRMDPSEVCARACVCARARAFARD